MSDQEALFGPEPDTRKPWQKPGYDLYGGTPPHERQSDTSLAAAVSILPHVGTYQRMVYDWIAGQGPRGATDDEIELALGLRHQSASARRRELVLLGVLERVGTRPTRSGRQAVIWRAK